VFGGGQGFMAEASRDQMGDAPSMREFTGLTQRAFDTPA
jgi:hypothetical protein